MNRFLTPARAVGLISLLCLAAWAMAFFGKLPAITDVFLHTLPSRNANLTAFAQGRLPLWDAAIGCGTPQWASGLGAGAYPPYWIWNLTGLSHWLVYLSFLHLVFAFLGFFLWARSLGIAPVWSSLGALSFAGSLHMTRLWGYPVFLSTQAWTPWVFYLASRFLKEGSGRWLGALCLAAACQVLAGYPHFTFYSFCSLGIWVCFQSASWGAKIRLGLALVFSLALAAVHWLPFLDLLGYATRGSWGSPEKFPYFFRWSDLTTLFSPTVLGRPEMEGYRGHMANANFMLYFGLIPLVAWSAGALMQKFQGRAFWGLSTLGWLAWMMGWHLPLWRVLPERLLESMDPTKAVGAFLFAACTCAGLALTRLFREGWNERKRAGVTWLLAALWALDILSVAPRITTPVPDPFQKPQLKDLAARIQEGTRGSRLLSLRSKDQLVFRKGEAGASLYATAAEGWVRGLLANSQQMWDIRSAQAYLSLWVSPMEILWASFNRLETYRGILPDVTGTRLLLFPVELKGPRYRTVVKGEDQFLIENASCLPDAWPAKEGRDFPDLPQLLQALQEPGWKGEVFFSGKESLPPPRRDLPFRVKPGAGWRRASGGEATYQGDLVGAKWLFWNETFAPGWRAWVDGRPTPIHRAFGFFMAVPLPLGPASVVDFRYEPVSFRLGLFLSLVFGLLGLATLSWARSWKALGGYFPENS